MVSGATKGVSMGALPAGFIPGVGWKMEYTPLCGVEFIFFLFGGGEAGLLAFVRIGVLGNVATTGFLTMLD